MWRYYIQYLHINYSSYLYEDVPDLIPGRGKHLTTYKNVLMNNIYNIFLGVQVPINIWCGLNVEINSSHGKITCVHISSACVCNIDIPVHS